MGSYNEGIDASVGGVVWVRRRNGSWWPGRIIGPDDLPSDCPPPTCKGTPVQLLGRENGSVDWYNLEKTTRVKAFRCGEYDEWIERAEESAVIPGKKPVLSGKYVRREDAILHALELEKVRFSYGNKRFSSGMNNKSNNHLTAQAENISGHSRKLGYLARALHKLEENTTHELSLSAVSFEQDDNLITSYMQNQKNQKTPNDSEDDNVGIKRMRDLQDVGLRTIPITKSNLHVHSKGFHEFALTDSASISESDIANGFYSTSPTSSSKYSCTSLKQNQSQMVQLNRNFTRKNHHHSLSKVSVGTSRVKIPSFCRQGPFAGCSFQGAAHNKLKDLKAFSDKDFSLVTDNNSTGCSGTSCEETLSHACETEVDGIHLIYEMKNSELPGFLECTKNGSSHGFVDTPLVMGENLAEDFSCRLGSHTSRNLQSRGESRVDLLSQLNDGPSETSSTSSAAQFNHVKRRMDKGTSGTYSERKRNSSLNLIRNVSSESLADWADQPGTFLTGGVEKEIDNHAFIVSPISDNSGHLAKCRSVSEVVGMTQDFSSEMGRVKSAKAVNRICNSNFFLRDTVTLSARDVPIPTLLPQESLPHSQSRPQTYLECQLSGPVRCMPMNSPPYDVKLNVQASYQGPRVPLVSLISKLNSKAIVGYPITVEVLENGFSNGLVISNGSHPSTSSNNRPLKYTAAMVDKLQPKAQYASESHSNIKRKIFAHSMDRSLLLKRKSSYGKKSRFSSRKIRRLSSITVDYRDKEEERRPVMEKIGGPSVSCVPLRLIFSRLNEALSNAARPMNFLASS